MCVEQLHPFEFKPQLNQNSRSKKRITTDKGVGLYFYHYKWNVFNDPFNTYIFSEIKITICKLFTIDNDTGSNNSIYIVLIQYVNKTSTIIHLTIFRLPTLIPKNNDFLTRIHVSALLTINVLDFLVFYDFLILTIH